MLAIRKVQNAPGVCFEELPVPEITEDEVLVRILKTALCKSDLDVVNHTPSFAESGVPLPFTLGHEFCGEVVSVGRRAAGLGFVPGDHLAGETHVPCGVCKPCRTGYSHICPDMKLIGRTVDGCFAEYMAVPAAAAIPVPKSIPAEWAALFEPLGVAVHAVEKAQVCEKHVMILGTGTIGSMALECAKLLGAASVTVVSRQAEKLARAKELGADHVIDSSSQDPAQMVMEITHGEGMDRVIEMSGTDRLLNLAVDSTAIGGRVVCVGVYNQPVELPRFTPRIMYREIELTGIFGRKLYDTWYTALDLVSSGRLNLQKYVGLRLPLREFETGVEQFSQIFGRVIYTP